MDNSTAYILYTVYHSPAKWQNALSSSQLKQEALLFSRLLAPAYSVLRFPHTSTTQTTEWHTASSPAHITRASTWLAISNMEMWTNTDKRTLFVDLAGIQWNSTLPCDCETMSWQVLHCDVKKQFPHHKSYKLGFPGFHCLTRLYNTDKDIVKTMSLRKDTHLGPYTQPYATSKQRFFPKLLRSSS